VLVIAHRGASFDFPENTLPAFERAIEVGADYVEFDVHNDLSVTHERPRRGLTYPTLDEVVELCRGRIGVMVRAEAPAGRHREASAEAPRRRRGARLLPAAPAGGSPPATPRDPHRAARRCSA